MMHVKNKILFAITLLAVLLPLNNYALEENDIQCIFTQTDSGYTFYGSFKIKADPECILEISFSYKHIRALAPNAREVLLIDSGMNWNQISYAYQKFIFFENTSVWYRKLDKENQRVDFTLVSSKNNQTIMPRMISSSGFYQIKQQAEYIIVEYYQRCRLSDKSFTNLYLSRVKKEAVEFMYLFSEYVSKNCCGLSSGN